VAGSRRWERSDSSGRIGRRALIADLGALGAGVSGLAAVLTGCAPAGSGAGATPPRSDERPPTAVAVPSATAAAATAVPATPAARIPAVSTAEPTAPLTRGRRGGGGTLMILLWQAPTILNTHLATGTKDFIAARCCVEPLLTIDGDGNLSPVLAVDVPSRANGGLHDDGRSVTYKLKRDVQWADGHAFTADDVVFTWKFITNKETAAGTLGYYLGIDSVDAIDPLTVRVTFKQPTPAWYLPFVGSRGPILPKHAFTDYAGASARNAPFNLKAFGTGPYLVESFTPGDRVTYTVNANYRDPTKPFFDRIELKGGGDAASAARAVLQTGEFDYAWNLQIEWEVLQEIQKGGRGVLVTAPGSGVEQIHLNQADPNKEVDGERASLKAPHPFLTDPKVREAMALAIDRDTMAKQLYGSTGDSSPNVLTTPASLASRNTSHEFSLVRANQLLDAAGYRRGGDGIRVSRDGARLSIVFASSVNSLRQKEQALVKDGWQKIGIDVELKAIDAGAFFDSRPSQVDNINHFYWDALMYTDSAGSLFPLPYMKNWYSGNPTRDVAQKSNDWQGQNRTRWLSQEFNTSYEQASRELDADASRALFIKMNDLVVNSHVAIPLVDRRFVSAQSRTLKGPALTPFDGDTWNVGDWVRVS
jgi:peptide/nickel transport system substrate-binding protein